MSLSRVAPLRTQAQDFNTEGKKFGANNDWEQATAQFLKAIDTITLIEKEAQTDDDYRQLAKFQHNVGISHYNKYSSTYSKADWGKTIEYLTKAIDTLALIKNPNDKDDETLANYNRLVYLYADQLIKPVSDEFDEYTQKLINELEATKSGKEYSDQDYRKLSRWNLYLGNSMFEENREKRLQTAISMQLKVVKRFDWDERELTACYLKQAELCEKEGLLKDAADACLKATECMNKLKASDPGDDEVTQEISEMLKKYGENPQNNKKESALASHGFWVKCPMESSSGDKEVIYIPSSFFGK